MNKVQCVSFLDHDIHINLLKYISENHIGNLSKGVNHILREYFTGIDHQDQAVTRLNNVIQRIETEKNKQIKELEHQLQHSKIIKEV
jgi:alpha-glucuronidase